MLGFFFFPSQANQTSNEFHLNVDVQEFYPRVQLVSAEAETKVNYLEPSVDLEHKEPSHASPKSKVEAPKATKTSHPTKPTAGRASKKEIIEGIKSMEQQNIDLMASKHQTVTNANHDDEWNVIKKGKKVKVVKDIKLELSSSDVQEDRKDKIKEVKIEQPRVEITSLPEPTKKSPPAPSKPKKSKGKNKKKKQHMSVKQDGFEIIEPEFNHAPAMEADEATPEMSEDETAIESDEILPESAMGEPEVAENVVLNDVETKIEPAVAVEQGIVATKVEYVAQVPVAKDEKSPEVIDLPKAIGKFDEDDDVIDISDEDICCKVNIPLELASVQEVEHVIEALKELKVQVKTEVVDKKPEVQANKLEVEVKKFEVQVAISEVQAIKPEVQAIKPEVQAMKPEVQAIKPEVQLTVPVVQAVKSESQPVKLEVQAKKSENHVIKPEVPAKKEIDGPLDPFQDMDFFNDRTNIAALERDLMENLRLLDDDFDLKSPIINPLYDFPITSAVRKWLQAKESESFDSLFHVQNFKKLSELYDDDEDDETESEISEKEMKSETDSDYASDFQAKANGNSPTCSTHAKGSKCNKLIAKESFCALM